MTAHAVKIVESANVLLGPTRVAHCCLQNAGASDRFGPDELVDRIEASDSQHKLVVLASGDPLFYGTARYVCSKLGKDRFGCSAWVVCNSHLRGSKEKTLIWQTFQGCQ